MIVYSCMFVCYIGLHKMSVLSIKVHGMGAICDINGVACDGCGMNGVALDESVGVNKVMRWVWYEWLHCMRVWVSIRSCDGCAMLRIKKDKRHRPPCHLLVYGGGAVAFQITAHTHTHRVKTHSNHIPMPNMFMICRRFQKSSFSANGTKDKIVINHKYSMTTS